MRRTERGGIDKRSVRGGGRHASVAGSAQARRIGRDLLVPGLACRVLSGIARSAPVGNRLIAASEKSYSIAQALFRRDVRLSRSAWKIAALSPRNAGEREQEFRIAVRDESAGMEIFSIDTPASAARHCRPGPHRRDGRAFEQHRMEPLR